MRTTISLVALAALVGCASQQTQESTTSAAAQPASTSQAASARPEAKIRIEGNADERGSAEYNLALGQRRADAVMKIMTLLGVSEERIETVSFGKEKPKASGHNESAWSEN